MAKINIVLNNKNFEIDDAALQETKEYLHNHLSTKINGSGTAIEFDGVSYNIDSEELSIARRNLASHLETVAGEGLKIVIDGVEFFVDSTKLESAITGLEENFKELESYEEKAWVKISGVFSDASVTINGIKYVSSTTLSIPIGTVIECNVKTDYPDDSKHGYVYLNGTEVHEGKGTYHYTVIGNVDIVLTKEAKDNWDHGVIRITEE